MTSAKPIPGYTAGTWSVDPVQSRLTFSVKHFGLQTVHGTLRVHGSITVADEPSASSVEATVDLGSVDTKSKGRDKAIRSTPLLDVANHPTASYRSTGLAPSGSGDPREFVLDGELTFLGITRPVPLSVQVERFIGGADRPRPLVTGRGHFVRSEFGLAYRVHPRFLDRAIGQTISVDIQLEGSA